MINDVEARAWAQAFGVDVTQIRRDHLISHVLDKFPQIDGATDAVFIGGTALCRTHLDGLRVSEDIDLLVDDVATSAAVLVPQLPRMLRRTYPDIAVAAPAPVARGRQMRITAPDVPGIEVQLIARQAEDNALTFTRMPVSLRYHDLPATVKLRVPSAESFVAMKYVAYRDRQEPRDLFDLAHLTMANAFNEKAAVLIGHISGAPPFAAELRHLSRYTTTTWNDQLAHQAKDPITAREALRIVRDVVEQVGSD